MNREDLFAPPTQEELDLFAPPTQEEINQFVNPVQQESTSIAQALGHNAASGATLGFSDELLGAVNSPVGAVKALLQKVGIGNLEDKDVQKYTEARDKERKLLDLLSEEHPIASFAGNVAGSIPLSILAGAGALGTTAKALSTSKKVADAAKTGAIIGAASNLGASENDSLGGDLKDAAVGGVLGGFTGAIVPALVGKGKSTTEFLKEAAETPATSYFGKARELARDSKNIFSHSNRDQFADEIISGVEDVGVNLKNRLEKAGEAIGNARKALPVDKTANIDDVLLNAQSKLEELRKAGFDYTTQDADLLEQILSSVTKKDPLLPTPKEKTAKLIDLLDIQNKLNMAAGVKDSAQKEAFKSEAAINMARNLAGEVDRAINLADKNLGTLDTNYKNLYRSLESLGIDPKTAFQKTDDRYELTTKALSKLSKMVRSGESTPSGEFSSKIIEGRIGRDLQDAAPEVISKLTALKKPAENLQFATEVAGLHLPTKAGLIEKGFALGGHIVGATERMSENLGRKAGQTISKMSPVDLEKMARYFETKGTTGQALASKLMEIKNQDVTGRNATLFSLLQSPTYRTLMLPEFAENEKDKANK